MLGVDITLLRRGGNQLGVISMAAALVAIFLDQTHGPGKYYLVFGGVVAYLLSSTTWESKPTTDKPVDTDNPVDN